MWYSNLLAHIGGPQFSDCTFQKCLLTDGYAPNLCSYRGKTLVTYYAGGVALVQSALELTQQIYHWCNNESSLIFYFLSFSCF